MKPAAESDLVGHILREGLATRPQIDECLTLQTHLAAAGEPATLVALLTQKGYVTSEQARRLGETAFGRYRIVKELGRGGMGAVYQAWDPQLQRSVAIKRVLGIGGPERMARFQREARAAARLRHPHIVAIHEVGEEEGEAYFTMDFVDGMTLADLLKRRPKRLREEVAILAKVADAVAAAHREGIVHRDLKPANILLDAKEEPYVSDFGLAKEIDAEETGRLTMSGQLLGTPAYMSPEQSRGEAVTPATDVWALGAMLYETMLGRLPFEASSVGGVLSKVQTQEPAWPGKSASGLPRDLRTICLKCLEKEPERRYGDAGELAEDLERWLHGEPIRAHPPSVTYRVRKFVARRKGAAVAAVAALISVLAVGAWAWRTASDRARRVRDGLAEGARREQAGEPGNARDAYAGVLVLDGENGAAGEGFRRTDAEVKRRAAAREEAKAKAERERDDADRRRKSSEVYQQAARELHALRLRSYRADWVMAERDFGEFQALVSRCREEMKRTGDSGDGWWVVGRAWHLLGNWPLAEEAYDAGLRTEPDHGSCLLFKARLLIDRGIYGRFLMIEEPEWFRSSQRKLEEAHQLLARKTGSGQVPGIEIDLARGYGKVVRGESAREYCAEMLEKWKGTDFREEFYLIRGLSHWSGMVEDATAALAIRPAFGDAYLWRAVGRMVAKKDLEGAIADCAEAVRINPRCTGAHFISGLARQRKGDLDGAISDYTRALGIARHAGTFFNRGLARLGKGEYDGAIADYGEVIEIDPLNADAFAYRGTARERKGDLDGAAKDWERGLEVAPANWPQRRDVEARLGAAREKLRK
ncbi:MAG: protein kinase [Planctomycetes bacterium]|nr:protein kinase [Planctomycetota bacterium]